MTDHEGDRTDALDVLCLAVLVLLALGLGGKYMIDRLKRRAELAVGNLEATLVRHPTKSAIVVSALAVAATLALVSGLS